MATTKEKNDAELGNGDIQNQETEVDPCLPLTAAAPDPLPNANTPKKKLTLTKQNGRVVWSGTELEGLMRKKYGVNRDGFLLSLISVTLLVLFLFIILIMIVMWPRSSSTGQLCTKAACFQASANILPSMDRNVDRCTDLYGYGCGGWSAINPKPPSTRSRWDQKVQLRRQFSEDVRDLIATLPHTTNVTSVKWKIKHFYDSCMALDNIQRDDKQPLRRIISELGGWSVLRDFSQFAWDDTAMFVRLHAEYGVNPFFTVSIVDDPFRANKSVVQIAPPVLILPQVHLYEHKDEPIATSYRDFMKDVVRVFGATQSDANLFSNEMFFLERRLAEILPPVSELSDTRTHQVLTVGNLKKIAQSLPMLELLRALLPDGNITESTPVLVQSVKYLTPLSRIFSELDRHALNNYIIWHLVKTYSPYLGQDLQELNAIYLQNTQGIKKPLDRWEFCAESLLKVQGVALIALLQSSIPKPERTRREQVLREIFDNLKWSVKDGATKADWIDLELYQHIVKKLDNMKIYPAMTNAEITDNYLDRFYSKLVVQKNDFFLNIRYVADFQKQQMLRQYQRTDSSYQWLEKMINPDVSYLPTINSVVVGQMLVREPWFHPDYPASLQYGGLGTEMAAAILSAILPPYGLYSHNGTLLPPTGLVANLSRSSIERQLTCLMGNSSAQALSTFLSISSLRQSLKALRRSVSNSEFSVQPGLENFTEGELLILRYTQSHCSVQTPQDESMDIAVVAPLRGSLLISTVMDNLKAASDILGCSVPTNPCKHLL